MTINWTLKSVDIPLSDVARITGISEASVNQLLMSGALGPPPPTTSQAKMPLFHLAALFAFQDADKIDVARNRVAEVLPCVAGAAYIRLALTELAAGRCVPGRGTPALTSQLWAALKSERGKGLLEQHLSSGHIKTKKYACFTKQKTFTCDDLGEIGELEWPIKAINSWSIASRMKRGLPGTLFSTDVS